MAKTWDVVIAGLGAMGSAIAFSLAQAGRRVLGIDRFAPPHAQGSTHGGSRIIREAYFEDPLYVPFAQRAFAAWREIETRAREKLLRTTGGLMIGPRAGDVAGGALRSASLHGLPFEELPAPLVNQHYPALRVPDGEIAAWEPMRCQSIRNSLGTSNFRKNGHLSGSYPGRPDRIKACRGALSPAR